MNWAGLLVAVSIIYLGFYTLPYGIVILLGLYWLWKKG